MKIIRNPNVYLVGKQTINNEEIEKFLSDNNVSQWDTDTEVAGEKLSEIAGRLCYVSYAKPRPGGNKAYLNHILEVGHGSILEHEVFNFIITGVSRSFSHEFIRHRIGISPSMLSQRYVDESTADFIEPDCIAEDPESHEIWLKSIQQSHNTYCELVEKLNKKYENIEDKTSRRKLSRQAARSVLPNATETKIFITANARALRNFIELRCNEYADVEIRKVATLILKILQKESPNIFGDYEISMLEDGTEVAKTKYRKT